MFAKIDHEALTELALQATKHVYQDGNIVARAGSPCEGIIVVAEGHLDIVVENTFANFSALILERLEAPSSMGEYTIFKENVANEAKSSTVYQFKLISQKALKIYYISRRHIMKVRSHNKSLDNALQEKQLWISKKGVPDCDFYVSPLTQDSTFNKAIIRSNTMPTWKARFQRAVRRMLILQKFRKSVTEAMLTLAQKACKDLNNKKFAFLDGVSIISSKASFALQDNVMNRLDERALLELFEGTAVNIATNLDQSSEALTNLYMPLKELGRKERSLKAVIPSLLKGTVHRVPFSYEAEICVPAHELFQRKGNLDEIKAASAAVLAANAENEENEDSNGDKKEGEQSD